jgi:adenosylcobinamide-phosphate synthase
LPNSSAPWVGTIRFTTSCALGDRAEHAFDTGRPRDAALAWLTVVLPLTLAVVVVHYLLASISVALTLVWNVLLLYLTLGFRQFSHYFTDIHEALNRDDLHAARTLLHEWTGLDTVEMPVSEIVRHTLEAAIVAVHRHVFGVFFWFLVPIGPGGVVLYRTAEYLSRHWNAPSNERSPALGRFAAKAFYVLDWAVAPDRDRVCHRRQFRGCGLRVAQPRAQVERRGQRHPAGQRRRRAGRATGPAAGRGRFAGDAAHQPGRVDYAPGMSDERCRPGAARIGAEPGVRTLQSAVAWCGAP